jgi:inorganic pyrophosphatase
MVALRSPTRSIVPLAETLSLDPDFVLPEAALGATRTSLPDGTVVSVRPDEVASMKAVFDMLDENRDGMVMKTELQELHRRLGEHIEEAELDAALKSIEADGDSIDFPTFMRLWQGSFAVFYEDTAEAAVHESRRKRYQARFQMIKARISNPEVGRITTHSAGTAGTLSYRVGFTYRGHDGSEKQISPWHDIPLRNADMSFNFVCEIPKWTRAKFEIATGEPFNPIKQDTQNGVLRDYKWGDMAFNYGAFPQTWEDPSHVTPETKAIGDNDPIDVIEIGQRQWPTGAIVHVKVLGVLALIDAGETDWKVITISTEDPMASRLHDIEDVKAHMPGAVESFTEWLRLYKTHGGIVNEFGFDGEVQNRAYAEKTIEETHEFWKALVAKHGKTATV